MEKGGSALDALIILMAKFDGMEATSALTCHTRCDGDVPRRVARYACAIALP